MVGGEAGGVLLHAPLVVVVGPVEAAGGVVVGGGHFCCVGVEIEACVMWLWVGGDVE